MDRAKTTPRAATPSRAPEALPYVIELWDGGTFSSVERVLARALNAGLAREIFRAAKGEHPERRITLRKGGRIVADSAK
jgi:hypothetical protein